MATLDAHVTGAGELFIDEQDSLTLRDLSTVNGPITVTAGGTLTAQQVVSQADSNANDITLTTTADVLNAVSAGGMHLDTTINSLVANTTGTGDILYGHRGNDQIEGGAGDDELFGELGADNISGGSGSDVILGDVGRAE